MPLVMCSLESDKDTGEIGKGCWPLSLFQILFTYRLDLQFLLSRYRCEWGLFLLYPESKAHTGAAISDPLQISLCQRTIVF